MSQLNLKIHARTLLYLRAFTRFRNAQSHRLSIVMLEWALLFQVQCFWKWQAQYEEVCEALKFVDILSNER